MKSICMTAKEAARIIRVDQKLVYYYAYMGILEGWKIRNIWRFYRGSVEAYAQERNKGRNIELASGDPFDQGRRVVPSLFGFDDPSDDLRRPAHRVQGRRRVADRAPGLDHVPFKAFEPVIQMDLFAAAV